MKLILENVRGFAGYHEIRIAPITILVGENSSGKTTVLAALAAALQPDFPTSDNLFNRAPFELGSFDTIATYRGGKYGRAASFSIGWSHDDEHDHISAARGSIISRFISDQGVPRIENLSLSDRNGKLTGNPISGRWRFSSNRGSSDGPRGTLRFRTGTNNKQFSLEDITRFYIQSITEKTLRETGRRGARAENTQQLLITLFELVRGIRRERPAFTALAPLRTRPHRTYDEIIEEFKPEGDHIPLVLARLLDSKTEGSSARDALEQFGAESGLFDELRVKRMGRSPSDPFQLRIKANGPDANLVDVGYGVSQSLPIIVDTVLSPKGQLLIVQQPEVHLHPKAQAALGSFFVEQVKEKKQFVIETHSDFLVDRIRMEVGQGNIEPTDVQIVYLERNGLDVIVHLLALDELGNISNAPVGYRSFFLDEEMRLLSRGS